MNWQSDLTKRLEIHYPIIQAPMLGVSTPEMAAAVSNEGGLGSLAVGGLSPEETRKLIQKTKSLTSRPFAVNLFVHDIPSYQEADLAPMQQLLLQLAERRGYKLDLADMSNFTLYSYHDQIEVLLQEKISIVSFTFGCLDIGSIQVFKDHGCILIGSATCLQEAQFLEAQKIDMITIQGIEAGGHRGTFLEHLPLPQIGLFSLLPQISRQVKIPCIAAGGINSAETIKASFELGALAVQIGTAFIGAVESNAILAYKGRLREAQDTDTSLTRAFSGRWARGIKNEMMHEIERSGIIIPPYPIQNSLTTKLRKLAQQHNDSEYTNLWAGQSSTFTEQKETKEIFKQFVKQYEALYS